MSNQVIDPFAPLALIDRTTLEHYQDCPFKAHALETKAVKDRSIDAESGQIVHDAISAVTHAVYAGHAPGLGELAALIKAHVQSARPDLQQHALDGIRHSAYSVVSRLLYHANGQPRSPEDIMAFDGGPDGARGQLSTIVEIDGDMVQLTCEVDLLLATASIEMAELVDYKTGYTTWTAEDVKSSFQFGTFYPWLVFITYPALQRLRVCVHNTRANDVSPVVEYQRAKFVPDAYARIVSVYRARKRAMDSAASGEAPDAWPKPDLCATCPACHLCPEATSEARDVASDPAKAALQLVALTARVDALEKLLTAHVDKFGEIDTKAGTWYGRAAPKKTIKSPAKLYALK